MHNSILLTTLAIHSAVAVANWPPLFTQKYLGFTSDQTFNPATYRDGGGGGVTGNGTLVINFSDSVTCRTPGNGPGIFIDSADITSNGQTCGVDASSFTHNSFAIMNTVSPGDPTQVHDFGNQYSSSNSIWKNYCQACAAPNTDTGHDVTETAAGARFFIWPNNNMLGSNEVPTLGSNQLISVYQASMALPNGSITDLYTTLATIDVSTSLPSGKTLPITRTVPKMFFNNNQTVYGKFGTYSAGAGGDGYIYLFATPSSKYLVVARVPWTNMTDMSAYTYWDGTSWSKTMPLGDQIPAASLLTLTKSEGTFDSGDIFYSPYFSSPVLVFGKKLDTTFYISYLNTSSTTTTTTSSSFSSGFSTPEPLYKIDILPGGYPYSHHVYPAWDKCGKTLLVSWAEQSLFVRMGVVRFEQEKGESVC